LDVVLAQESEAVTVPRESLMQRADGAWVVFVVEKGALRLCPIKRGLESGGRVAVSGLNPGAQVVTSTFLGWANLADGLKVEVAQ
jgi:multidrug efflux pump subunit AcrA (membrane-fusion protein)